MTNIEALNILNSIVEQVALNGKQRDEARALYGQIAQFIITTETAAKVETKNTDHA